MESLGDFKDFDGANNSIQFIKKIPIRSTSEHLRINDKSEINTKKIKQGEVDSNIYYKKFQVEARNNRTLQDIFR